MLVVAVVVLVVVVVVFVVVAVLLVDVVIVLVVVVGFFGIVVSVVVVVVVVIVVVVVVVVAAVAVVVVEFVMCHLKSRQPSPSSSISSSEGPPPRALQATRQGSTRENPTCIVQSNLPLGSISKTMVDLNPNILVRRFQKMRIIFQIRKLCCFSGSHGTPEFTDCGILVAED